MLRTFVLSQNLLCGIRKNRNNVMIYQRIKN